MKGAVAWLVPKIFNRGMPERFDEELSRRPMRGGIGPFLAVSDLDTLRYPG